MSRYIDAVERNTEGLDAVSTGLCPGCAECADDHGMTVEEFDEAYEAGEVCSERHFSWSACGICGSHLGGDREVWHAVAYGEGEDRTAPGAGHIVHFDDACTDCAAYLANGDEPDGWDNDCRED